VRNTVCFPELRRGRIGIIVATQIGRYSPRFHNLPGWRSPEQALAQTQGQIAYYRIMEECGEMVQLRTWADVENHASKWIAASDAQAATLPIGYLLSLEGADSILSWRHLERSRAEGLIALGPVHYGPGIYGCGTDDEGPLTAKGCELLKEMERLGIILDVTHLCDESMRNSLDHFSVPVWASHHNCRALANWNRQLTGNARHVGIGTDLDGGYGTEQTPLDLDSIADLTKLDDLLAKRGYSADDITGIFRGNFFRFLRENLK
jgi:membrane dipeptidase